MTVVQGHDSGAQPRARKRRVVIAALFLAFALAALLVRPVRECFARRQVEEAIGVALPAEARHVRHFIYRPLRSANSFELFVRFDGNKATFDALVTTLGLTRFGHGNTALLPYAWGGPEATNLPWWRPSENTPLDLAASRSFGQDGRDGWLAAKQEGNHVYIHMNALRPEALDGPF